MSPSPEASPPLKLSEGQWDDNTGWEFYLSDQMPPRHLCTAVACIAILEPTGSVLLTRNRRGWEVLGGHIEPGETVEDALVREAEEEGGFTPDRYALFGHRQVTAKQRVPHDQREGYYPHPVSYIPHFIAVTSSPLREPTGEEVFESKPFTTDEVSTLAPTIEQIVRAGIEAYVKIHDKL